LACTSGAVGIITATSTTTGISYNWQGTGIVSGGTTSTVTVDGAGTYTVTVTDPTNGCTASSTTVVSQVLAPTASVSNDVTITIGNSTLLAASGGGSYLWSTSDTTSSISVSPTETTTYCVTVTNASGCFDTACVRVTVEIPCPENKDLAVPNAFSPNGDYHNDRLCLQGWSTCIADFQIIIYDRWGEKVFESTDASFCWDGTYKGKDLDPAVFVYYITAVLSNSNKVEKKGNISLIR
jgi:gliding motility-associated-like protein